MSEIQECATGCGRPTQDVLLLCSVCLWGLECDLGDVGAEIAQLDVNLRRQAASGAANDGGKSAEVALPLNAAAYEAKLTLEVQLVGWVRDLADRHGEEDNLPAPGFTSMSRWLLARKYRIATHPAAADIHSEITRSMARIRNIVLGPAERVLVGVCDVEGCPGWLYAEVNAKKVRCRECDTEHPVDESRERLLDKLADRLMTQREIAGFATHYGVERRRAMKLMASWVDRGRLLAASKTAKGEPTYPFGSTLDMLRNTPIRLRNAG